MTTLNVLSLNVHKGFDLFNRRFVLPGLREAIGEVSADAVFLQEVLGEHVLHATRHAGWPAGPHYEFLADSLWPQFAYGRNAVYPHGHHGNALLSRFPITHWHNLDVSIAGHEQRGLLHARLRVPGHDADVHAVCVHLGLREAHRRSQIELLCTLLTERIPSTAPVLVAGDFNDWRNRGHALLCQCGLVEVFEHLQGRTARTFPARWPMLSLDRIYVRNARAVQARVLSARPWSHLSDHAALWARLEL